MMMNMELRTLLPIIFFLGVLLSTPNTINFSLGGSSTVNITACYERERQALLTFKQHLNDTYNLLSSWGDDAVGNKDCCRWRGVVCSNKTNDHQSVVVQLNLANLGLGGELNPVLLELKHLNYLDLSWNNFNITIPPFLGSLHKLRYLNLVSGKFVGKIPPQLGNLTSLRHLDVSYNNFNISIPSFLGSLQKLRYLKLVSGNFVGTIPPQLSNLTSLQYLDISYNDFNSLLPPSLGSLQKLTYLNLAYGDFVGMVPPQLGNLSSLRHLDMDGNWRLNTGEDLEWLSHLSSLEYLRMGDVNLSIASNNWFPAINMLPSLQELDLSYCYLRPAPSLSYVNLTSLKILDLSFNNFDKSYLPEWLYTLSGLVKLDLSYNHFGKTVSEAIGNMSSLSNIDLSANELEGEIPRTLGKLCNLQELDLSQNKLQGEITEFLGNSSGCMASSLKSLILDMNKLSGPLPDQLGRLKNLEHLSLRENSFSGSIPSSFRRLSMLKELDLGDNKLTGSLPKSFGYLSNLEDLKISLEGVVTDTHFANLTGLKFLDIHSTSLNFSQDWVPPFQLAIAYFRACQLGPRFPNWLRTQKHITSLDLSNNGISGTIPTWFWNMSSQLDYLNLSYNQLHGELPDFLQSTDIIFPVGIYLNSNRFEGRLPRISSNIGQLDLSRNSFSGPISDLLCNPQNETNDLKILDLSGNLLSGELPQCWFYWKSLRFISLGSNNITGKIPSSMGSLLALQSLHLRNNSLSGEVPSSLQNCTELIVVDLGENALTGRLPTWMGGSVPNIVALGLRLNKFYGAIPQELCYLTSLRLLDLAHNNLSGGIPRCFSNFSGMALKMELTSRLPKYPNVFQWVETALMVKKGTQMEYIDISLLLGTNMDLSSNSLSGEIPEELTSLLELQSLNLSWNHFTGKIPDKIGTLSSLESLDFSRNGLSGLIPQSMTNITSLAHLDLSFNSLSGEIPSGTQLRGFSESSYMGNQALCGPPLKECNEDGQSEVPDDGERATKEDDFGDWLEKNCFYISLTLGFVIGFWGFWGVLVVKKAWRFAYFGFLDDMGDKLCNFCSCYKLK